MNNQFLMSYSSGKDSTLALHRMIKANFNPRALITTMNGAYNRSWFHGVNLPMLKKVSESLNIELIAIDTTKGPYGEVFKNTLLSFKEEGIDKCAFGDIDIEDHKNYWVDILNKAGFQGIWPLWKEERVSLVREVVSLGYKAKIKIVNTDILSEKYLGLDIDNNLIDEFISLGIDPAAEAGEFHTFVYDGEIFSKRIDFSISDVHRVDNYSMVDFIVK